MVYIDREKFAEAICNFPAIDEDAANAVILLLRRQHAADVVEVKHGEWIEVDSDLGWTLVRCSVCNKEYSLCDGEELDEISYCPVAVQKWTEKGNKRRF